MNGLPGITLLLFLLPDRLCSVYFIVAVPDPVENIVGSDGKV